MLQAAMMGGGGGGLPPRSASLYGTGKSARCRCCVEDFFFSLCRREMFCWLFTLSEMAGRCARRRASRWIFFQREGGWRTKKTESGKRVQNVCILIVLTKEIWNILSCPYFVDCSIINFWQCSSIDFTLDIEIRLLLKAELHISKQSKFSFLKEPISDWQGGTDRLTSIHFADRFFLQ